MVFDVKMWSRNMGKADMRSLNLFLYFSSGYMASLRGMPSSSRIGSSSWRYSAYWPLFSTLALMPALRC